MSAIPVAVIQGCSSGLGLSLAAQLLRRSTNLHVVGTSRSPEHAREAILQSATASSRQFQLSLDPERLTTFAMDMQDEQSMMSIAGRIRERFGSNSVRLLINVAGILHVEKSLQGTTRQSFDDSFLVNAIAPMLFSKQILPLMASKETDIAHHQIKTHHNAGSSVPSSHSIIANISARVGSITDNQLGGWYSYRMSKAAQNQGTKVLSRELSRNKMQILALALHPGTVKTEFSEAFVGDKAADGRTLFEAEESANRLLDVIGSSTEADQGSFRDCLGKGIAW